MPRIFDLPRIEKFFTYSVIPHLDDLFVKKLRLDRITHIKNLGAFFICLSSLSSCQPALWGAPPPLPTISSSTATAMMTLPNSTVAPTFTAVPPTAAPTPIVLNAAQVWASPAVPSLLHEVFHNWGFQIVDQGQNTTNLYVDVVPHGEGEQHVSTWTYALVAPFPTIVDDVSTKELMDVWTGASSATYAGMKILMEQSTLETFKKLWGEPASGVVIVLPADQLLQTAWDDVYVWAIIPFEKIEPKWKVLMVDGQSPIQKAFDPSKYSLIADYQLMCSETCELPDVPEFSYQNRDPKKMTTVIMTGVTALVRATAKTMDMKGVLYPGEAIRDILREADILHINNEVPFFSGCPDPDPKQAKQVFCSATRYIDLLTDIGTDVMELSGDHFADYHEVAMYETLDIYNKYKIPYYGGGRNVEDGRKPLFMEVNGNKIMFIGCNYKTIYASATDTIPGAVPCDFDYMTKQITEYRAQGWMPISTFQYHEFDTAEARPQQKLDFRRMADAGAVVVSGSQAHVPQVMEFYQDAFIHYGLGNLFFDQMGGNGTKIKQNEFIDRHVFYDGRYLGVEILTAFLEDYSRPRPMTELERDRFLTSYFLKSGWAVMEKP